MATCIWGVIHCLSKAYFTKNTTARNNAKPPTHANTLIPKNFSQPIGAGWAGAGTGAGGVGEITGRTGIAGGNSGGGGRGITGAAAGSGTGGGCTTGVVTGRGAGAGAIEGRGSGRNRSNSSRFSRASSDAIRSRDSVHFRISQTVAQSNRNSRNPVTVSLSTSYPDYRQSKPPA